MKSAGYILFISVFLLVHLSVNVYIFKRGWSASEWMGSYRFVFSLLFVLLAVAYPAGRFAERSIRGPVTEWMIYVGSFWLAVMVYLFFLLLLIDLIRLGNHFLHFLPSALNAPTPRIQKAIFIIIVSGVIFLNIAGHINAIHPRVRTLNLAIDKRPSHLKTLNIVVASDLHLGRNLRGSRLGKAIEMINALEPDLVLLPGDTMDEDVDALSEKDMAVALHRIHARYGVFAVTGNHEYYRGLGETVEYLGQSNVTVLLDEAVKVAGAFYVIGRKDRTSMYLGEPRKSIEELAQGLDHQYPLILMDHQPLNLEEAQQQGIDLQISGHTHHGQLFPFNLLTKSVYEVSWGYLSKGNTHYYVSCGAGAWGPPVRLGSVPEIVQIRITFTPP